MIFWLFSQSKRKFERECREAEKAQQSYERLDNDTNATKADVEKVSNNPNWLWYQNITYISKVVAVLILVLVSPRDILHLNLIRYTNICII